MRPSIKSPARPASESGGKHSETVSPACRPFQTSNTVALARRFSSPRRPLAESTRARRRDRPGQISRWTGIGHQLVPQILSQPAPRQPPQERPSVVQRPKAPPRPPERRHGAMRGLKSAFKIFGASQIAPPNRPGPQNPVHYRLTGHTSRGGRHRPAGGTEYRCTGHTFVTGGENYHPIATDSGGPASRSHVIRRRERPRKHGKMLPVRDYRYTGHTCTSPPGVIPINGTPRDA